MLVLLDCLRAFDVFNRVVLLVRLRAYGVAGLLFEIVASFFTRRFQFVRVGSARSILGEPSRGGPQGSVITLFCFLILIITLGSQ